MFRDIGRLEAFLVGFFLGAAAAHAVISLPAKGMSREELRADIEDLRASHRRLEDVIIAVSKAMNHADRQQDERLRRFEEWEKNGVLPRRKGAGNFQQEK